MDIDANKKTAGDFGIEAVPTLILLTPDGKIISRQTGFMEIADLLAWLKTGRARAAAGQWEGTAPGAQFNEFIHKAAADNLGTNEIQKLVDLLGDADPVNREQAGKLLLAQRENAVPPLIEAVGNLYLGERIAAGELLQRLAPNATPVDPWQSPQESSNIVVALRKWWAATGRLPPLATAPATNSFSANSVKEAIEQLRVDDPTRRTAAMTDLVRFGPNALPPVREAIKRAEKSGDQRALGLLEDVRWTILVPDAVEQQSGGIRNVLARGKSSERQAATERLGAIGHDALGVLIELTSDPDPLVVESAIRALSGISGGDAVAALSTLLKSTDSNLRMTAAQALGRTKNPDAVKPLLAAIHDSDEVVACTALSAIEETQAADSYQPRQRAVPDEIISGLKSCLGDPRWRVRAAAAEVAGKLSARQLDDVLKKLLNDADGFVVKSALTALGKLGAAPESDRLVALSQRLPSLQGDAMEMMLQSESEESAGAATKLYKSGNADTQLAILNALVRREIYDENKTDEEWKPLLSQAVVATNPRVRRSAAAVLNQRSPKLAAQLVGSLLNDYDRDTRLAAADAVLRILDKDGGGSLTTRVFYSNSSSMRTNQPIASVAQLAAWHRAMLQREEPAPALNLAAAVFATGDGTSDLPMLLAALANTNGASAPGRLNRTREMIAIGSLMPKLSLPAGRAVLEKLSASPFRFALAASQSKRCKSDVADYLLDPARFKSVVEPASGPVLSDTLGLLAGFDYEYQNNQKWSLWSDTYRTKSIALALLDSTNAAWRAAAVFSLGLRADARDNLAVFEKAAADPNPWVRASAAKAIARNVKDRPALEPHLAPLLADTNLAVASAAALALLEPETRQAAGLDTELGYFAFESVRGGKSQTINQNDQRPLTTLDSKPPYLAVARKWLAATAGKNSGAFAVLLAQFGEFDGVDKLVAQLPALNSDNDSRAADALLTGIALSHDTKYVPALQQVAAARHQDYELRKILQALKGMTGPDARQLRLDINKKLRNTGGSSAVTD
jgi:HEAT repeat protein